MLKSYRLGTVIEVQHLVTKLHNGCVCVCVCGTVCRPTVLLKLKLVPVSDYLKNMEYMDVRKFIDVYVCQK